MPIETMRQSGSCSDIRLRASGHQLCTDGLNSETGRCAIAPRSAVRTTALVLGLRKILGAAIIGDALKFFDYFLIGFVLAFIIGPWKLTFGQSAVVLPKSALRHVPTAASDQLNVRVFQYTPSTRSSVRIDQTCFARSGGFCRRLSDQSSRHGRRCGPPQPPMALSRP
jgi:hypothetical protein